MAKMQNGSSSTMPQSPENVHGSVDGHGNSLKRNQPRPIAKALPSGRQSAPSLFPAPLEHYRDNSLTEMTFEDAKSALFSTTGGLLVPKATETTWHSIPLAFAMLPALAGTIFTDGEGIVTDVLLLSLVAIFLHWFVKFPWEWYQSSRQARLGLESAEADYERQDESKPVLQASEAVEAAEQHRQREALVELRRSEIQALISCFLGPLAGGYLMYWIRSQLSRPSGGLISNFNLSVFLLAAELKPFAEVVRLVRDRNVYLQQVAHQPPPSKVEALEAKVDCLEAELRELSVLMTKAVERDADVDALNRAVRRYEKKEALHCIQTDARLVDMDNRLNDVLTLAAAATARHNQQTFSMILFEWACAMLVIPFSIAWRVVQFPKEVVSRVGSLSSGLGRRLKASGPRLLLKKGNSSTGKKKEKSRSPRGVPNGRGC